MIIWLNGAFGAGKTTTARALVERLPDALLFDSEQVGAMLARVLDPGTVTDFQQWRPWRRLVVGTARELLDHVGGVLVVPQSVLVEEYWDELRAGFAEAGIPVHPFLLHTDRETLTGRITGDEVEGATAHAWRLAHLDGYERAFPWLTEALTVVDTTDRPPGGVVDAILATLAPHLS